MLERAVEASGFVITEVVSGRAPGADRLGEVYALKKRLPCRTFPADWKAYGKGAGHIRNGTMAQIAECGIALWDGTSPGTRHMIETMAKAGKPVYIAREGELT